MKESYEKGLANHSASNPTLAMVTSRVWHGQEVHAGQVFSSPVILETLAPLSRAHAVLTVEGNMERINGVRSEWHLIDVRLLVAVA